MFMWFVGVSLLAAFMVMREYLIISLLLMSVVVSSVLNLSSGQLWCLEGHMLWDGMALILIILSVFIILMSVVMSKKSGRESNFVVIMVILTVMLVFCFSVSSWFLFFFFFESILIPLTVLILGWGKQPERLQACSYMVIYTVAGSFFYILGVSNLYSLGMTDQMSGLWNISSKNLSFFWWLYLLGFLIKLPLYPFHLWLPKAHVEAPVSGSMILAGIILKLGGYGVIRLSDFMVFYYSDFMVIFFIILGLLGGFYCSLMCLRQVDMKSLVAYSSVSHMSLVLVGCVSDTFSGFSGSVLLMAGHGLCSSGLFAVVTLFYSMSGSRMLLMNKGYLIKSPALSVLCFLLCSSNMAAPPSLNFLGEVVLYVSASNMSCSYVVLFGLISYFSASYSLYLYGCSCHGPSSGKGLSSSYLTYCDLVGLLSHWIPLNYLFLFFSC